MPLPLKAAALALLGMILVGQPAWSKCTPTCSSKQEVDGNVSFTCIEWGYDSANDCGSATTTTTTTTTTTGATAALDWGASFVAWWKLDAASGARNATGGSCAAGVDCDLTDNNTVTNDSTNKKQGTAAALFADANNEYLSCASATCNELDLDTVAAATWGCWARTTADSWDTIMGKAGATKGYALERNATNDRIACYVNDGTSDQTAFSANSVSLINTWVHQVCTWDDTNNETKVFADGAQSGTTGTAATDMAVSTDPFYISSGEATSQDWTGQIDECFVIKQELTDAEICRICSCQIDGSLCTCNGTVYATDGRRTTDCGSCDAGNCNAVAP